MFIIIWLDPVLRKWRVALEDAWMSFVKKILWKEVSQTLTLNFLFSNTKTPVLFLSTSELLSLFWEKKEFQEIVAILKMTQGVVSFFKGWSKVEIKTPSNWTWYRERINSSICFEGLCFNRELKFEKTFTAWGNVWLIMVIRIDFASKNKDYQGIKAPQPSKMPRFVRRLHTQRTLFQKKMAAELYPLISLFIDSKPEKYGSYFLACANSKHQFNTEVVKCLEFWLNFQY